MKLDFCFCFCFGARRGLLKILSVIKLAENYKNQENVAASLTCRFVVEATATRRALCVEISSVNENRQIFCNEIPRHKLVSQCYQRFFGSKTVFFHLAISKINLFICCVHAKIATTNNLISQLFFFSSRLALDAHANLLHEHFFFIYKLPILTCGGGSQLRFQ